jgi:type II secretory pathway component GspD/PulD (secretin)
MILPDYYSEDCWVSYYDMTEASINRLEELALQLKRDDPDNISEGTLKALFEHMGVTWPEGSYIKPSPILGKLIVRNTQENLEVFYKCLSVMDVQPYQIEIELVFLACERRQISALGPDGVSAAALTALWTNGQAELLAAPRVLTQPSQEEALAKPLAVPA